MFTSVVWLYLCVAYIGRHKGSMDLSLCTFLFILFEDFRVGVLDMEECRRLPSLKADKQRGKKEGVLRMTSSVYVQIWKLFNFYKVI